MKKFIRHLIFIFIITWLLLLGFEYVFTWVYRYGAPRNKVQSVLKLNNKHYDIAFYGSSRVENHIDCQLIKKITGKSCINLGFSGANLGDMVTMVELNKTHKVTFDSIFFQLDYNYNSEKLSPYFLANLVPFMNNKIIDKALSKNEDYYFYKWIPFYKYIRNEKVMGFRELISILFKNEHNRDVKIGFKPHFGQGLNVSGRFPKHLKEKNLKIETLVKLLKDDTPVYFFTAPYCKELENRNNIDKLEGRVKPYRNFYNIYDNKPEYFFNCGHLNVEGAKAFTLRIIEEYNL